MGRTGYLAAYLMFYKIVEVNTARVEGHPLYVLVNFWQTKADFTAGDSPFLINDFLLQGDPNRKWITEQIESYMDRAMDNSYEGDHSSSGAVTTGAAFKENGREIRRANFPIHKPITRDNSNPRGRLTADVRSMRNRTGEQV